jgi:hypothetical protein
MAAIELWSRDEPKKEIKIMRVKATLVISVLVLFSTAVWATPGSGVLFNTILNRAQVPGGLHSDAIGETADGSFWHLQLKTEGAPSDVIVQDQALAPGGYGGWHTHPGQSSSQLLRVPRLSMSLIVYATITRREQLLSKMRESSTIFATKALQTIFDWPTFS